MNSGRVVEKMLSIVTVLFLLCFQLNDYRSVAEYLNKAADETVNRQTSERAITDHFLVNSFIDDNSLEPPQPPQQHPSATHEPQQFSRKQFTGNQFSRKHKSISQQEHNNSPVQLNPQLKSSFNNRRMKGRKLEVSH